MGKESCEKKKEKRRKRKLENPKIEFVFRIKG